jgi:hypothetical protein
VCVAWISADNPRDPLDCPDAQQRLAMLRLRQRHDLPATCGAHRISRRTFYGGQAKRRRKYAKANPL